MANPKGIVNVERRTWDEEEYAKRARERAERGDDYEEDSGAASKRLRKEEFQPAPQGAAGPERSKRAYLKARSEKVDYESKLGKTQVVTSATSLSNASGYYCEVCKCVLKDNLNYLDHINGKKHQRALGYSMRVERSSVDQVKSRLGAFKAKRQQDSAPKPNAQEEFLARVAAQEAEEAEERRRRKEAKLAAKQQKKSGEMPKMSDRNAEGTAVGTGGGGGSAAAAAAVPGAASNGESLGVDKEQPEEEEEGIDPAMAAMMGFAGFGGSKR